jgi:alpha-beta hydrolase superfamily lysophospholipase
MSGTQPCVVMGTGFGGTQDTPSIIFAAQQFASSGFAALTFDYRHFGESYGEPRQIVRIQGQLADFHAAVGFARSQAGIDPDRIALWGTSLGGGHVVSVAARDPRIAAVVAQVPFNGFPKKVEGRSSEMTRKLLGAMFRDAIRGWFRLSPHYIPSVGNANELAVMASPQAAQLIQGMDSKTWRNEVAPRALFEMMKYKPGDFSSQLQMPLLVCVGEFDRETLGESTIELVQKAPRGELKSYPFAHFDIYLPEFREQVVRDQIEFLRKNLVETKTT